MIGSEIRRNVMNKDLHNLVKQLKFSSVGFYFLSFLIPIISFLNLKISGLELGFVFSLRTIGFAASSLLAGFLSNRRHLRSKLIFGASVGRFVSYVLIYLSFIYNLYWMMTLGMFILGVGAGFFWTPFETTVADATEYENRSEAFGIFSQQSGIGGFIGATVGFSILWVVSEYSFSSDVIFSAIAFSPLLLYGMSNIYAGIRVLQLAPRVEFLDIEEKESVTKITKRAIMLSFIFLLVLLFSEAFIGSLVGSFIEFFLLKNITQDMVLLIIAYVPGGILSVIIAPRLGRLADKLNPRITLSVASVVGAGMTWLLINSSKIWQFSMIFIIDTTVVATAGLVLTKVISTVSRERRGTVFGLHDSVTNLSRIAGPLVGGALWDVRDRAPFILSIAIEGVLAVLYPVAIVILSKTIDVNGSAELKEEL
ncbi:MAG: MFS transporter [Asgard group archaeon]|nr:MFS transporter [Asgard group archaeon]